MRCECGATTKARDSICSRCRELATIIGRNTEWINVYIKACRSILFLQDIAKEERKEPRPRKQVIRMVTARVRQIRKQYQTATGDAS